MLMPRAPVPLPLADGGRVELAELPEPKVLAAAGDKRSVELIVVGLA